jgi:hypothetical protein
MPNEIYHKSNWGNANAGEFGDVYFDAAATNKLYNHSDYYENSDGTDKILRDLSNKASIVLTPTAYSDGSLNTVIPPYAPSYINNIPFVTSEWGSLQEGWSIDEANNKLVAEATWTGINKNATFSGFGDYVGKTVRVSFDAVVTAGSFDIYRPFITSNISESGSYSFTKTSVDGRLRFRNRSTDFAGEITNIKFEVIEEADFDFSRGSSATRVNEQGLIESIASGLPRIDYSSGFGSLLLEPQRTNLITYSEDFSQWGVVNGVVVTDNFAISPDGTQNAAKVIYDGTSLGRLEISTGASGTNTQSVYLKTASGTQAVSIGASSSDLTEVTVTSQWQRFTHTGSGSYPRVLCNDAATIYVWGAQLEAGSYPTSYIVSNSGSATTRSADVANNSGNADLFNDSEGVLYVDSAALADDGANRQMTVYGTGGNSVRLYYHTTSNTIRLLIQGGGTTKVDEIYTTGDITLFHKIAGKYKDGDTALWINGFEVETSNATLSISGLSSLNLETSSGGTNVFLSKIKELAVFKEALTDAELESLTSWVSFTEMATDLEYTLE